MGDTVVAVPAIVKRVASRPTIRLVGLLTAEVMAATACRAAAAGMSGLPNEFDDCG